jgi:cytoskeleton protein RodZ
MAVGDDLRQARLARRLAIADIVRETKIPVSLVRAIEQNQFVALPGGLFTRGYLRAYAREVALDPEEVVEQYRSEFEVPSFTPTIAADDRMRRNSSLDAAEPRGGIAQTIALVAIGLAAMVYFGSWRRPAQPAENRLSAAAAATAAAPKPVATTGSVDQPASGPLKIEISATGPCWVAATVDGAQVVARLLNAGDREQLTVADEVALRVGDPATFAFTINGAPAKPLGAAGQAATVRINRRNFKSFL